MKFSNTVLAITLISGYVRGATASHLNGMKPPKLITALVLLLDAVRKVSGQNYFPFVLLGDGGCIASNGAGYSYVLGIGFI
eukprot:scaffold17886_cov44-Cyclotella_meneghiniana.AAC.6